MQSCSISVAGFQAESTAASGRCPVNDLGYGSPEKPIKTILVFKDTSDWYMDLQIMLDICVGGQSQDPIQCPATAMHTCLGLIWSPAAHMCTVPAGRGFFQDSCHLACLHARSCPPQ